MKTWGICYPGQVFPALKTWNTQNIPQGDGSILQFKGRFGLTQSDTFQRDRQMIPAIL